MLNQTPSAFRQLIQADATAAAADLALRTWCFGGEALDCASLRRGSSGTATSGRGW